MIATTVLNIPWQQVTRQSADRSEPADFGTITRVPVHDASTVPSRLAGYRRRLGELQSLPHDWNLDGGAPVTQLAADRAVQLLEYCAVSLSSEPETHIGPLGAGGVVIEFTIAGKVVVVAVGSSGDSVEMFDDLMADEREVSDPDVVRALKSVAG